MLFQAVFLKVILFQKQCMGVVDNLFMNFLIQEKTQERMEKIWQDLILSKITA